MNNIKRFFIFALTVPFCIFGNPCTSNSPPIYFTKDLETIQELLPEYSKEGLEALIVDRRGEGEESNMTTLGLHTAVRNRQAYLVTLAGLVETDDPHSECLEHCPACTPNALPPRHVEIEAVWDKNSAMEGDDNNILGDNGRLILESDRIDVPVVEATDEALAYYRAKTVSAGDVIEFPNKVFPIWVMDVGKNYIEDFIMTPRGGGMYLEYHCDQPHFHMPLSCDAGGYLLLAKEVGEPDPVTNKQKYHLTGFKIPYGKGVYTFKCSIHADAALTGKRWLVGYSAANDYSTVLIREKNEDKQVSVNFIE